MMNVLLYFLILYQNRSHITSTIKNVKKKKYREKKSIKSFIYRYITLIRRMCQIQVHKVMIQVVVEVVVAEVKYQIQYKIIQRDDEEVYSMQKNVT